MTRRIPLSKLLLIILKGLGETAIELGDLSQAITQRYSSAWRRGGQSFVADLKRLRQRQILQQTLNQLKRSQYLSAQRIGKRLLISLTNKGKADDVVQKLLHAKPYTEKFSTVVIFDVPRTHNWARKQFRQLLKQGGFIKLQQSVWISSKDTYDVIAKFIKQVKIQAWVNVFRAKDFLRQPKME